MMVVSVTPVIAGARGNNISSIFQSAAPTTQRQAGAKPSQKAERPNAAQGVFAHCLSASAPTTVPSTALDPKPAMKSRPMSRTLKP